MKKVYLSAEKKITFEDAEKPAPFENRVLIKTKAVGICGTDVHSYMGETIFGKRFPFHIGHEVSGVVEAVGPDCRRIKAGDHVVIDPLIACGVCDACRGGMSNHCENVTTIGKTGPGGFSDYILTPETSVYGFDPKLDFRTAALAEPLACVIHGVERAGIKLGQSVLVKGAGSIGQMHMLVSRFAGAALVAVADLNKNKLKRVKELGADLVLNPSDPGFDAKIREAAPKGFDVVIDCTGSPSSVAGSVPYIRKAGMLLVFGVCPVDSMVALNPHEIYMREITVTGSFCFPKSTLLQSLTFLAEKRIEGGQLISAVLPRNQLAQAIEGVGAGKFDGKVIITTEE